jgi:hypothetical protein
MMRGRPWRSVRSRYRPVVSRGFLINQFERWDAVVLDLENREVVAVVAGMQLHLGRWLI